MALLAFLGMVVTISLSGVMAPGPLSTLTVARGRRDPLAGFWLNLGHAAVEVPLIVALLAGLEPLLRTPGVARALSMAGGIVLVWMGLGLLRRPSAPEVPTTGAAAPPRGTVAAGAAMTAFNPYWFLWWLTVGMNLLALARGFGAPAAVAAMVAVHLTCDFAWGTFLSWAAHRGGRVFRPSAWRWIEAACGGALVLFGGGFLYEGLLRAGI